MLFSVKIAIGWKFYLRYLLLQLFLFNWCESFCTFHLSKIGRLGYICIYYVSKYLPTSGIDKIALFWTDSEQKEKKFIL